MTQLEWAKNEVALACKKDGVSDDQYQYAKLCFDSAMKAYESLIADNHSGNSWAITRTILYRLMLSIPLTAIEDTEDVWTDCSAFFSKPKWQCKRYSSLFKEYDNDGNIVYSDSHRTICYDQDNNGFNSGLASLIIDELFPITMPYMPSERAYKLFCKESLSKNGKCDYDTIHFTYALTPNGERVEVNRYFHEENGAMKEISKEEYEAL